ncbi:MAG: DUF2752 domain-containing protein [Chitinophagaceae bacterium]|nr:DUF2752 domain-containing protein [Chitinophagaceae bacterium]
MNSIKKNIHILLLLSCMAGYVWLLINYFLWEQTSSHTVCLFKNITHLPCPSCGITRAIFLLLQGKVIASLSMNPLGIVVLLFLMIVPILLVLDWCMKKGTIQFFANKFNILFSNKKFVIPFFTLIFINWVWNIFKHL